MKIVLLTNQSFLEKELRKSTVYSKFVFIKDINEFFDLNLADKKFIFLHHLDSENDHISTYNSIKENFNKVEFIALRNNTNNIEGCSLLKRGYKSYVHSISNINILEDVIDTVESGKNWVYPELMQFLIQSVPLNDRDQDKLLEILSVKELEVLELVAQGLTNADIAKTLDLAEVTVKKHISSMFKKLGVKDRLSLALSFKNYK